MTVFVITYQVADEDVRVLTVLRGSRYNAQLYFDAIAERYRNDGENVEWAHIDYYSRSFVTYNRIWNAEEGYEMQEVETQTV